MDVAVPAAVAATAEIVVPIAIPISIKVPATVKPAAIAVSPTAGAAPFDVKRVAFAAALGIFDTDHGSAAVAGRIAHQHLVATSIHATEVELERVRRKRLIAHHA